MTAPYRITGMAISGTKTDAIIHGPGIEPGGLRREFLSEQEAQEFVDGMNLGFQEGFKEGTKTHKTFTAGSSPL